MLAFLKNKKIILAIVIVSFIGAGIFLLLYSELLNPKYDAWLLTASADPTQHYVGWAMYRHSDWSFPLGLANNYGYPFGIPITYTDSIPLLAIIFKLLNIFLPPVFQYFGIWLLLCFVLQAVFGYLLIKIMVRGQMIPVLGSILFVLSPAFLFRPFALAGQWLILAGLWLVLKPHKNIQWWQWSLLFFLSLLIHPYLFFMNGFLMLADLIQLLVTKKTKIKPALLFFIWQVFLVTIIAYSLGLFLVGETNAEGFGEFSMNLNSLINPLGHWSILLADLPVTQYQGEGFSYLGLGILFLTILSLYSAAKNKILFKAMKQCWPLLLICLFLTLLALSNVVTLNSAILIDFKLPKIITNNLLGVVRASGRFFWPVFYLILLASFYILKTKKTKVALVLIILAIFCQTTDLSYKLKELGTGFEQKNWSNQIDSTDWQNIAKDYKHISFLPVIPHRTYISFILFAAQNKMTVNNGYFARPIKGLDQYIEKENNEVKAGIIKKDTIYILTRDSDTYLTNLDLNKHLLVRIDRTVALCSYYREVHPNTNYQNGQELKVNMAN